MASPSKGARRIEVDGVSYLWRVRPRATRRQRSGPSGLTVSVEAEGGSRALVLWFPGARPDAWFGGEQAEVTPGAVAEAIRSARAAGWAPGESGPLVFFDLASGRLGASEAEVWPQAPTAAESRGEPGWADYDPAWLVAELRNLPNAEPWLSEALRACTRARIGDRATVYFVDPSSPEWQVTRSVRIDSERYGLLVLDLLEGQRIGAVEFVNRI